MQETIMKLKEQMVEAEKERVKLSAEIEVARAEAREQHMALKKKSEDERERHEQHTEEISQMQENATQKTMEEAKAKAIAANPGWMKRLEVEHRKKDDEAVLRMQKAQREADLAQARRETEFERRESQGIFGRFSDDVMQVRRVGNGRDLSGLLA